MKTKYFILAATAITMMVSCADEKFVGDENLLGAGNGEGAISFNLNVPAMTRADKTGSAAATDLNNQFYVYAIKNESADGAGNVQTGNLVFNNYVVKWTDNTAYTTTSNTKNWEYVGYTLSDKEQTNVTANSGDVAQTIKYWDFGADDYTFYAFSALPADIEGDEVTVTKVQNLKTTDDPAHTVYDNGYTVSLTADADLDKLYFAERNFIETSTNTDRTQVNTYGGNVTFRFHNTASKVRVAMYETVPGYSVTINKFTVADDQANPTFAQMDDDVTANFAANLQNCAKGTAGTLTVKYVADAGATQNHPTVSFDGTKNKVLALGTNLAASKVLTTTAPDATFDKSDKSYTSVFPNETNTQNLKLKVSYTLTAPVTGETITVTDATAEVPANYLKWKPGYAYTYIFKITDDKLYPITFDAVEVVDEDGLAEYITTVSEPSITTFGVIVDSESKFKNYVTGQNDYQTPTGTDKLDIYAAIEDNSTLVTPVLSGGTQNVKIYFVDWKAGATADEKAAFPITESSLAEAIAETGAGTEMISYTDITTDASTHFSAVPAAVTTVPGEDGVDITGTHAVKLTGLKVTAGTTKYYAVEYLTGKWNNDGGKTYTESEYNDAAGTLYTDADCTTAATGWVESTTYYKRTTTKNVYKVIKVEAPAAP